MKKQQAISFPGGRVCTGFYSATLPPEKSFSPPDQGFGYPTGLFSISSCSGRNFNAFFNFA